MFRQATPQMSKDFEKLAARAAPVIFVVLWSTGFVATKYVLRDAEPLTYLAIRMAVVVVLMAIIVAVARPKWPDRSGIAHSVVAGILVHGFYLGGTAVAMRLIVAVVVVTESPYDFRKNKFPETHKCRAVTRSHYVKRYYDI